MIKAYKNAKTHKVHQTGAPKGFKGLEGELAARRMDELAAAGTLDDLSPLKSVNLHKLKGRRKNQWAVNVNGPWRICFTPSAGGWENVEITDYHEG